MTYMAHSYVEMWRVLTKVYAENGLPPHSTCQYTHVKLTMKIDQGNWIPSTCLLLDRSNMCTEFCCRLVCVWCILQTTITASACSSDLNCTTLLL